MKNQEGAAAYIRVSTEEQVRGGVSLDAQEERIRAYCVSVGLELTALIREEGVSGSIPLAERPGGSQLIQMAGGKGARHVVCLKLDRLFRDAEDCLRQTRAWDRAGVAVHFIDMGGQAINSKSALGRMFLTLTAGFAELERNLIAERTRTALHHKRTHREVYGAVPFGYDRSGDRLVPNRVELRVVSQIREFWSGGQSLSAIARDLNDRGVRTKQGGRWHASTIRYLVRNELYGGVA
jgi:DNA invertase Pin-like site-specific DNA recombinase